MVSTTSNVWWVSKGRGMGHVGSVGCLFLCSIVEYKCLRLIGWEWEPRGCPALSVKCMAWGFRCYYLMLDVQLLGCNLCNAFYCCFSYHSWLELHYVDKRHKMATPKKWAQEEGIPVWEAECHLDSELFLDEYPRWRADGPQHPFIL